MISNTDRARERAAGGGFTLLEVSLAVTILIVAIMATSGSTLRMSSLRRQNRERAVAHNMVRTITENLHAIAEEARTAGGVWSDTVVVSASAGGAIGAVFDVAELNAPTGMNNVGRVLVITDETVTDADLGLEIGMPRDLNGDGDADDTNVRFDASILPIVVTATWQGASGTQTVRHPFYVIGY